MKLLFRNCMFSPLVFLILSPGLCAHPTYSQPRNGSQPMPSRPFLDRPLGCFCISQLPL